MTPFVLALVVTASGVAMLLPVLQRKQILDVPNARSSHVLPVPRGGGIAVVAGLFCAGGIAIAQDERVPVPILIVTMAIALVGWVDDLWSLNTMVRLAAQISLGAGLAVWLVNVTGAAGLPRPLFVPVVVIAFAAYINAFNFMDGINGISSLSAAIAGGWFAWIGYDNQAGGLVAMGLAVSGAALGFLPWNAPRARIFLGDVGSYSLGAVIGGLAVFAWAQGVSVLESCAPLLVYLTDTGWALAKRAKRRERLTEAHRDHVYQRLVDAGWSHLGTALVVSAIALTLCAIVSSTDSAPVAAWAGVATVLVVYLALPTVVRSQPQVDGTP